MLTAPVLLSAIPESYNSTRLIFSSVYDLSSPGISFSINSHDYAGNAVLTAYPTFAGFFAAFSSTTGLARRFLTKDNLSPAHIQWYDDNTFEILDSNYNSLDLNSNEYSRSVAKKVYNISVLSSINGLAVDSGNSNSVSADSPVLPLMFNKTYRTAQDWVTVPLVSGRKAIYVADDGSDSNDGLTTGTPKLTVSAAFNILSSGDHVYFKRGDKWTNQAFGGTSNGLPTNLCQANKSGSSLDCPTFIGTYGNEADPLPIFEITNSAITTFFFADNDDQYSGLKNFYVKCLHFTASGRDVTEENNGDDYPSFFTLLNTGGSAVATGASGDAISDNILIEGCRLEEIANAISIQSYYNSLVPGVNNTYNWGTSNFVSSYATPAAVTNVLIRRNIFKDLYFVPAGSVSRANGLTAFTTNVFSNPSYQPSPTEPGSFYRYNARIQALAAQGRQPKAIYLYGASGQSNIVEGNIFYRCGNKAETYPDTFDKLNATVLAEGGFGGVSIFRNMFYKCANIAAMQLDGGANLNNIYYRNPQAIVMMADIGLYQKKQYQGVPTTETFPAVSGGFSVKAFEGNFVPYWYWFNKNNGLSVIAKNIIEEPQDIGYNVKSVSGDDVILKRGAPEQTVEAKGTAIRILGGTVDIYNNYIGNISKGICTALEGMNIKGYGRNVLHWDRGANSITHEQTQFARQNKVTFRDNTINNHGTLWIQTHNYVNNYFNPLDPRPTDYLFEPSALTIKNNVFRNRFWNKNSPYAGSETLQDFGVGYLTFYSDTMFSGTPRIVFTGNKLGLNTGPDTNRGFNIFARSNQSYGGQYSIGNISSVVDCLFGTTNSERAAIVNSNPRFLPQQLFSQIGDSTISLLESYVPKTAAPEDNDGWTRFTPYNYGQPNGTRVFYVDPVAGNDNNTGTSPAAAFRNLRKALLLLQPGRPDWILLKRGTVFNLDELTSGQNGLAGPNRRHTNFDPQGAPFPYADYGIELSAGGLSKEYPLIIGAYGPDADPLTGNYFGSAALPRPLLTRRLDGAASSLNTPQGMQVGGIIAIAGRGTTPSNLNTWFAKNIAILDLHLSGINWAPPTSANGYCRAPQHQANARDPVQIGSAAGQASAILIEGVLVENFHTDLFGVYDSNSTLSRGGNVTEHGNQDILFKRCAFYLCYSNDSQNGNGRVSISYSNNCRNVSAVECVFDGGGHHPHLITGRGAGVTSPTNGQASQFSHNLYWAGTAWDMYLERCINARAASHGVQMRAGGKVIECAFIRNPNHIHLDGCESTTTPFQCSALGLIARRDSRILRNLLIESTNMGGNAATPSNYAIDIWNGSGCLIDDNILTKVSDNVSGNGIVVGMQIGALGTLAEPFYFFPSGTTISNNIIYKFQQATGNGDSWGVYLKDVRRGLNFKFIGNKIFATQPAGYKTIQIDGGPFAINFSTGWLSKSNNFGPHMMRYCTNFANGCSLGYGGLTGMVDAPASSIIPQFWNDNTSVFKAEEFPDPERTIAKYVDLVASEPVPAGRVLTPDGVPGSQSTKLEYYLVKARQNRKGSWDIKWTAESLNNYIREGFGKPPVGRVANVEQMMQNAITNLACNVSAFNTNLFPQVITNNLLATSLITEVIDADGGSPAPGPSPEDGGDQAPDLYEGADLVIYNPRSVEIKVVLDPEDPNSGIITLAPRKTTKIPYPTTLEIREPIQEVVARYNLSTMITRYAQVIARGFGSIPVPVTVTETPAPVVPVVD